VGKQTKENECLPWRSSRRIKKGGGGFINVLNQPTLDLAVVLVRHSEIDPEKRRGDVQKFTALIVKGKKRGGKSWTI